LLDEFNWLMNWPAGLNHEEYAAVVAARRQLVGILSAVNAILKDADNCGTEATAVEPDALRPVLDEEDGQVVQ
jgi:hypothetical protein